MRLALPKRVTGFVLPLAVSTFKIATPVAWGAGAIFVGWFYGIPLQVGSLATDRLCCGVPRLCGAWNPARRVSSCLRRFSSRLDSLPKALAYSSRSTPFPIPSPPCSTPPETLLRRHSSLRLAEAETTAVRAILSLKVNRSPQDHNHALQSNGSLSLCLALIVMRKSLLIRAVADLGSR